MAKSNIEYWRDRQLQTFTAGEADALELSKKLKENYDKAVRDIEKEINIFYGKFAKEQGITIQEAKKLLDKKELKSFSEQLQEYTEYAKDNDFDESYINELNLLKYRTKISRLEELKANIKFQIAKVSKKNQDAMMRAMLDSYDFAYLNNIFNFTKTAGISLSFAKPAVEIIKKYLSESIDIANYAIGENQIWQYKIPALTNILNTKIPQGIILGQNPNKVAKIAEKTLGTDFNNTVRLVRTEYNYIFNQATIDSYKECGVDKYQILATLDERTCDSCGPLDLLVVNLEDKEVGVNYPPFHPNCRCTTIPYFEKDEFDVPRTRIARGPDGKTYDVPEDLTYNEWKAGLVEHKGGVQYWKPKE